MKKSEREKKKHFLIFLPDFFYNLLLSYGTCLPQCHFSFCVTLLFLFLFSIIWEFCSCCLWMPFLFLFTHFLCFHSSFDCVIGFNNRTMKVFLFFPFKCNKNCMCISHNRKSCNSEPKKKKNYSVYYIERKKS